MRYAPRVACAVEPGFREKDCTAQIRVMAGLYLDGGSAELR